MVELILSLSKKSSWLHYGKCKEPKEGTHFTCWVNKKMVSRARIYIVQGGDQRKGSLDTSHYEAQKDKPCNEWGSSQYITTWALLDAKGGVLSTENLYHLFSLTLCWYPDFVLALLCQKDWVLGLLPTLPNFAFSRVALGKLLGLAHLQTHSSTGCLPQKPGHGLGLPISGSHCLQGRAASMY
jgi:hypothetical protein